MGRRLTVRIVAWAMRRDVETATIDEIMRKHYPHRDQAWRAEVYEDACKRVARRKLTRGR